MHPKKFLEIGKAKFCLGTLTSCGLIHIECTNSVAALLAPGVAGTLVSLAAGAHTVVDLTQEPLDTAEAVFNATQGLAPLVMARVRQEARPLMSTVTPARPLRTSLTRSKSAEPPTPITAAILPFGTARTWATSSTTIGSKPN